MQLHMAVEKREPRIVCNEIDFGALITWNVDYILEHTGSAKVLELPYFKRMTVQMNWVRISTLILQDEAITSTRLHREWIDVRKGLSVDCLPIETSAAARNFPEN